MFLFFCYFLFSFCICTFYWIVFITSSFDVHNNFFFCFRSGLFHSIGYFSCLLLPGFFFVCIFLCHFPYVAVNYETVYACEEKTLTIACEPGYLIKLIRANYGRFSIPICNDHGNVEWSVNCMSAKSYSVLLSKCSNKQNCSVLASTNTFGDPCPGTHKYLEAHYKCVSGEFIFTPFLFLFFFFHFQTILNWNIRLFA